MIKPGWKQDTCPYCGATERLGTEIEQTLRRTSTSSGVKISNFYLLAFTTPGDSAFTIVADLCMRCGIVYAVKASPAVGTGVKAIDDAGEEVAVASLSN